jgi:RNA polymerase sigma-70 factor, ECF subfamily
MSLLPAYPNGCAPAGAPDIDPDLLRNTQAYLESRCRRQCPNQAAKEAWDQFYRIYGSRLNQFARRYRLQPAELNDCLQEVWRELVVLLRTFHYDPGRGRFDGWLRTLVRSKATDLVRHRSRHPTESLDGHGQEGLLCRDPDPAITCQKQCEQQLMHYVLSKLRRRVSPCDYSLFHLRWIEGWTVAEIASAVDLTADTVSCRVHRVKQKLGRLLRSCKDFLTADEVESKLDSRPEGATGG